MGLLAPIPEPDLPRELSPGPEPASKEHLWRKEQLELAGLDEDAADLVAADRSIDLHYAVGVVMRVLLDGCDPMLALDILL